MAYLATGFDTARIGTMVMDVTDAGGSDTATVTPGKWCHRDLTGLSAKLGAGNYDDLATELKARVDAGVNVSPMDALTVDLATGAYTLDFALTTTVDFRDATLGDESGFRLAQALGFDESHADATDEDTSRWDFYLSGKTTYTSNLTPYYYLTLARDGITHTEGWPPYEVAGQTKGIVTTLANGYGIKPTTKIEFAEFRLGYQTQASVYTQNKSATVPWTYDQLVTHVGRHEPVALSTTSLEFVYKDRVGDFGLDQRESVWGSLHTHWHLDVAALFVGYL